MTPLLLSVFVLGALALPPYNPSADERSDSTGYSQSTPGELTVLAETPGTHPLTNTQLPSLGEGRQSILDSYSYFYLGPKLWYVPLFFSIYFLVYILALIIKAISRHKIQLPHTSAVAARTAEGSALDLLTERITRSIASATLRYIGQRALSLD